MSYLKVFVLLMLAFFISSCQKDQLPRIWQGEVKIVLDGDTIDVSRNGTDVRIRFYGIDCPENSQNYGEEAKTFINNRIHGQTVTIQEMDSGPDKYNRTLAKVIHNQEILNQILIENGLAWVYDNYCLETFCTEWQALETQARDGSRGLWSESSPQAPWDYRHTNP